MKSVSKYVAMINRLVAAGYQRDRALYVVFHAYGLSPEQLAVVQAATREVAA